ncbi:PREDICTED: F-box/FBD/LRR-repeat protein At1g13570-like [Ipomoea nil]|uniref:F-box/FBD/LRR-repeat protein At1g13570-like n=1 Tax=Ipomoea nil TaxID=35883 RepID=UPI000901501C|nr:PREDICTED: F-box/FBD/LRR-repeat protein At1g13570-like [Ipomoea nil]XP_019150275.1 PREDICTED: F-box/FBD/LRR-repeat protein At1g13570-like [Ipomoea nil]
MLEMIKAGNELVEKPSQVDIVDRISNLPWEVLDNILGRLPMDVVAKMSVLSKKWRNNWRNVSTITLAGERNVRVIYHVLLSHHLHIEKFTLSMLEGSIESADLTSWLDFLRRSGIKELTFEFNRTSHLNKTVGFSKLVSLCLTNFLTEAIVLENLIEGCPLLEKLKLLDFRIWDCLNINAHMLRSCRIEGSFKDVRIKSSPQLKDAYFNLTLRPGSHEWREQGVADYLVQFLGCLSQFKKLTLCGSILKIWAASRIRGKVIVSCDSLSVLALLNIGDDDADQLSALYILLQKASYLKEFSIKLGSTHHYERRITDARELFSTSTLNFRFDQLRFAKIDMGEVPSRTRRPDYEWKQEAGVALIKALFVSSPVLKEMVVKRSNCEVGFLRELLSVERASMDLLFKYFCSHCSRTFLT